MAALRYDGPGAERIPAAAPPFAGTVNFSSLLAARDLLRFRVHRERKLHWLLDDALENSEITDGMIRAKLSREKLWERAWAARDEIFQKAEHTEDQYRQALVAYVGLYIPHWRRFLKYSTAFAVSIAGCMIALKSGGEWATISFFSGVALSALLAIAIEADRWQRFHGELWIRTAPHEAAARMTIKCLKQWQGALRDNGVLPYLRIQINNELEAADHFSLRLRKLPWFQLRVPSTPSFHVPVPEGGELMSFVGNGNGCFGVISGPAGIGKTDLLRAIRAGRYSPKPERRDLRVYVDATLFDTARDLLFKLYESLCSEVIGYFKHRLVWFRYPIARLFPRRPPRPPRIGEPTTWSRRDRRRPSAAAERKRAQLAKAITISKERTTRREVRLKLVRFGREENTSESIMNMYDTPEISEDMKRFVDIVMFAMKRRRRRIRLAGITLRRSSGMVIIGVDHLEQLRVDERRRFLDALQYIFSSHEQCLLVAMTTKALIETEAKHRFDRHTEMEHFDLAGTKRFIEERVMGLSEPFLALAHCLSDGSPQSVRKEALAITVYGDDCEPEGVFLPEVTARRVYEHLKDAREELRGEIPEPDVGMMRRLEDVTVGEVAALRAGLFDVLEASAIKIAEEDEKEEKSALHYRRFAVLMYHLATVLNVFNSSLSRAQVQYCAEIIPMSAHGPLRSRFDLLTKARRCVEPDNEQARKLIDEFRAKWRAAPDSHRADNDALGKGVASA